MALTTILSFFTILALLGAGIYLLLTDNGNKISAKIISNAKSLKAQFDGTKTKDSETKDSEANQNKDEEDEVDDGTTDGLDTTGEVVDNTPPQPAPNTIVVYGGRRVKIPKVLL